MAAADKRLKYVITGSIELKEGTTLAAAEKQLSDLLTEARQYGEAKATKSIPRMVNVEV